MYLHAYFTPFVIWGADFFKGEYEISSALISVIAVIRSSDLFFCGCVHNSEITAIGVGISTVGFKCGGEYLNRPYTARNGRDERLCAHYDITATIIAGAACRTSR